MRNLSEDLKLSKLTLDIAAEAQPAMQHAYGEAVADAQKAKDEAENRLDLRSGELWISFKSETLHGKAPTADDLKYLVAKHPEIVKLKQELAEAAYSLKLAQASERAIESKKSMIETLQRLHGASYFSTPNGNAGSRGSMSDLPART